MLGIWGKDLHLEEVEMTNLAVLHWIFINEDVRVWKIAYLRTLAKVVIHSLQYNLAAKTDNF